MATITPIRAPVWPPKPDLSDEVEWGPLPTNDAYTLAYRCWECPNDTLWGEEEEPEPLDEEGVVVDEEEQKIKKTRKTMEILAYKVYRHLTLNPDEPHDQPAERVQEPPNGGGWPFPRISDELPESQPERTELEGHSIMNQKDRYWTIKKIEEHLQKQQAIPDIRPKKSLEWRQLLHDHVNSVPSVSISTHGLCPRSDLRSWGLQRQNQFIIPPSDGEDRRYNAFELYTWAIHLSPYNPTYWLSRAYLFYQQCLFDLALGDAYRAWYLVEVLINSTERNKQPGLYPRIWDAILRHIQYGEGMTSDAAQKMRKENGINYFVPHVRRSLHHIISLSLLALRAWEDYEEMDKHLPARLQQVDQYKAKFEQRQKEWRPYVEHTKEGRENKKGSNEEFWEHEERMGAIFPRPYPQAGPTIDRTSEAFLQKLNGIICHETNWPLRIDRDQGSGLRVCANRDINEGEMLFAEEPSARSHLRRPTDGRPMEEEVSSETFCENCKRPISARDRAALEGLWEGLVNDDQRGSHSVVCACLVADPHLSFCRETLGIVGTNGSHEADELEEVDEPALSSRRRGKRPADQMSGAGPEQNTKRAKGNAGKRIATATSGSGPAGAPEDGSGDAPGTSCLQKARQLYHYRVCGKDWRWLHNAMGRISEDRVKGTPAVSHERHGTFLSLLLREVFDMTLKKRNVDPGKHYLAHEINPMIPLQSESPDGPFPFGWSANIVVPFGILQELGVNIFKDLEFDTWVIQTVLRKLLINAVPWDSVRRGNRDPVNISISKGKKSTGGKSSAGQQESSEKANIENLYIHTGFALFNHACSDHANARWSWDDEPPPNPTFGADLCVRNRIVVKSTMAITENSEILLKYYPEDPEGMRKAEFERLVLKQKRVLGQRCNCEGCDRRMGDNYEEEL